MRTLNVVFESKEYDNLEGAKVRNKQNWHDFILTLLKGDNSGK